MMLFSREKKCPSCYGINFSRAKRSLWLRLLMPNTQPYFCNGCRRKVYVLPPQQGRIKN